MASHVVVIDSTARRITVKTTPGKYLSDVLNEACAKLGLNPSLYGLKYVRFLPSCAPIQFANRCCRHQNKQVDLSRAIRLSGLTSGAKLELVQSSRSPAVVSVALQLPEAEAQGLPNGRLTDKFSSTTTLWLMLRKFEAGVAGECGTKWNLTARGKPKTSDGRSGQGRLYYETPVLQVMGRELSSFTDLQRSLSQLGFNSGNVLIKLSFRTSETPLEEAMGQIEENFKEAEISTIEPDESHVASTEMAANDSQPKTSEMEVNQESESTPAESSRSTETEDQGPSVPPSSDQHPTATENLITSSSGRPLQ